MPGAKPVDKAEPTEEAKPVEAAGAKSVDESSLDASNALPFWQGMAAASIPTKDKLHNCFLQAIERIPIGKWLMDLGCGDGKVTASLAQQFSNLNILGIDVNAEAVANARAQVGASDDTDLGSRLVFECGDLLDRSSLDSLTPWPSTESGYSPFCAVILLQLVISVVGGPEQRRTLLRNAWAKLASGGKLLLSASGASDDINAEYAELYKKDATLTGEARTYFSRAADGTVLYPTHHFTEEELVALLEEEGFSIAEFLREREASSRRPDQAAWFLYVVAIKKEDDQYSEEVEEDEEAEEEEEAPPCLIQLSGHEGAVLRCASTMDGARILTAAQDGTARIWDAESGKELACLVGHKGAVLNVAAFPNGKRIVTVGEDHTGRIWDPVSGSELARLTGHNGPVGVCCPFPDSRRVMTAGADGTGRVWNGETGAELIRLKGHAARVGDAVILPGMNPKVLTASDDASAIYWDPMSGKEMQKLKGHSAEVVSCAAFADGIRCVTASRDGSACIWEFAKGEAMYWLQGHRDYVISCAVFKREADIVLTTSSDGTGRLWDAKTGDEKFVLQVKGQAMVLDPPGVVDCASLMDVGVAVTVGADGKVRAWDIQSGQKFASLEQAHVLFTSALSAGSMATVGLDGWAAIWKLPKTTSKRPR